MSLVYRIVVVGAGAVGKSALTVRFINGTFQPKIRCCLFLIANLIHTVRSYNWIEDSYRKQVEVDGKSCLVDIMDTAGQEEYSALRDQYMKTGDGFVLGYSITSQHSFEAAGKLKNIICRVKDDVREIPMMLVGNKCDLENERAVSFEEGRQMAASWKVGFIESSAKANKNVNQLFFELVRMIDKWREKYPSAATPESPKDKKRSICVLL